MPSSNQVGLHQDNFTSSVNQPLVILNEALMRITAHHGKTVSALQLVLNAETKNEAAPVPGSGPTDTDLRIIGHSTAQTRKELDVVCNLLQSAI